MYRLVVLGDVQGVGFRAKVKMRADALDLKGFAHNLPDGRVEICVEGDSKSVEELVSQIKADFGQRHIRDIEVTRLDRFQIF